MFRQMTLRRAMALDSRRPADRSLNLLDTKTHRRQRETERERERERERVLMAHFSPKSLTQRDFPYKRLNNTHPVEHRHWKKGHFLLTCLLSYSHLCRTTSSQHQTRSVFVSR